MLDSTDTTSRIALARGNLTAKIGELRRREARVRTVLSPLRHLANPWLHVGAAALIGYRIGRPRPAPAAVATIAAGSETLLGAIVRASLVAVAQAVVRRVVAEVG
jgi:protein gp37